MKKKAPSFFSASWGGRFRELLPLGAGLLLMGLALSAAGKRIAAVEEDIRRRANPGEVVVASVPIEAGEEFTPANLVKKSVPASGTGKRNVPAGDFELLLGSKAKAVSITGARPLDRRGGTVEADLFSRRCDGQRALTVTCNIRRLSRGCAAGDRVDLWQSRRTEGRTLVRNVPVIAVDPHLTVWRALGRQGRHRDPDGHSRGSMAIASASAGGKRTGS
jgi:Flp pilus assembly protein CpaB